MMKNVLGMDRKSRVGAIVGILMGLMFCLVWSLFVNGAGLNCNMALNGTCTKTVVLYLQNDTGGFSNAHAQNVSAGGTYNYTICCDADAIGDTITTSCKDSVFLKLSDLTNAHVEQASQANYGVNACISAVNGVVNCTYTSGSCAASQGCLASMASDGSSNATNAHIGNCSEYGTNICCGLGIAPNVVVPRINSSMPAQNYTNANLECSFVPLDNDGGQLYTNITWIKNGIVNSTNQSIAVTNGTMYRDLLDQAYTKKYDNFTCSVQVCDTTNLCGNWVNSSVLTIRNAPPSNVTLTSPLNGATTFDRIPKLDWINATDMDGDSITYNLTIRCYPACSADNRLKTGIAGSTNDTTGELNYFSDDGDYYNWSVAAYDGNDFNSSLFSRLNMQAQVVLSLPQNFTNFGSKSPGDTDSTTDNNPQPLTVQNDGNCQVNVNLSADKMLWNEAQSPSSYFQYKIDNNTGESGSFRWDLSTTDWTDIPISNTTSVGWLNWSNTTDTARIDINITVPRAPNPEPSGPKNSLLQFTGWYVKIT